MSNDEEIKRVNEYKVGTMVAAIEELERMKERYNHIGGFVQEIDKPISVLNSSIRELELEMRGLKPND